MHYPTTRAVQYEDVAHAADALLYEGQRPTIERIRLRIGRGSPNTVGPMLEQWFSGLGQRLNGVLGAEKIGTSDNDLPNAVLQSATALWTAACQQAQALAENACATQRAFLADEALQLQQARSQLEAQALALNERLRAMEETLQLSTQQLQESNERWKLTQRTLAQRDEETMAQRAAAAQFSAQQETLQQHLTATQTQAQEERTAQEERHRANEHRWIGEVDRARQEARKMAQHAQDSAKKIENLQALLERTQAAHQTHALAQADQMENLRAELSSAQSQKLADQIDIADLQKQINQQIKQINEKPRLSAIVHPRSTRSLAVVRKKLGKNR